MDEKTITTLVEIYRSAFDELVQRLVRAVERGTDTAFLHAQLIDVMQLLSELDAEAQRWIGQHLPEAYRAGQHAVLQALQDAGVVSPRLTASFAGVHRTAVELLADNLSADLSEATALVGRRVQDVYREIALQTTARMKATGTLARQGARDMRDELVARGLTGFVDGAGRQWRLDDYADMTIRTTVIEAGNLGRVNQLADTGHDLVRMTEHHPTCEICAVYQGRVYSVSGNDPRYPALYETAFSRGYNIVHPRCFPAGVLVSGPPVLAHMTRRYEGEMVIIHTASGKELPVTPNHPILTPEGWVAAGSLQVGDEVIQHIGQQGMSERRNPDDVEVPTLIEDVPSALWESRGVATVRVKVAAEDFHGDGMDGDVCVIRANRLLGDAIEASILKPSSKRLFGDAFVLRPGLLAESPAHLLFERNCATTDGGMRSGNLSEALISAEARHSPAIGFGTVGRGQNAALSESLVQRHLADSHIASNVPLGFASVISADRFVNVDVDFPDALLAAGPGAEIIQSDASGAETNFSRTAVDAKFSTDGVEISAIAVPASDLINVNVHTWRAGGSKCDVTLPQPVQDSSDTHAESAGDLLSRLAGLVQADEIVNIGRREFSGHVYNLQTTEGWYVSNGIITHNCGHSVSPYIEHLADDPERDQERSAAPFDVDPRSQRQRDAYESGQRRKRQMREDRRQWERYTVALPDETPTFSGFRRMKRANSRRWQELQAAYRERAGQRE